MAVIDEIIIKENGESKIVDSADNKTIDVIDVEGVDYHFAKANEVSDGICENAVNEPIIDMRIGGNSIQGKLPSEYQQVEFLESSGTQYIDTNYKLSANSNTELVISDLTMSPTSGGRIFGAWTTSTSNRYSFNLYSSTYLAMGYDNTSSAEAYVFSTAKTKLAGIGNKFYVDDVLIHEFASSSFKTEYTAYIFATHIPSASDMINPGRLKVHSCKIWDNDILVRDFIPCYRKSDNVAGLYDLVEDKFYTNAGTGAFLVGDNAPSPEAPIEVESVGEYDEETGKYKVPIKVSGKNLLNPQNITGLLSQGGTDSAYMVSSTTYKGLIFKCKPNTKYTLAQSYSTGRTRVFLYTDNPSNTTVKSSSGWIYDARLQHTFTTSGDTQYLGISLGLNENFTSDYKIWLVEGDYIDYEPYVEPTITNIYLKEPLRKIGNYADYLDYKNKKVVRKIASEHIDTVGYVSGDIGTYKKFLSDIKHKPLLSGVGTTSTGFAISNKFIKSIYNYTDMTYHPNQIQTYITTGGVNRVTYTFDDSSITNITQAQEKIGNGFECCYVMATPTEETIEIAELSTNDGTTIIDTATTIKPSEIKVDYWQQI